MAEVSDGSVVQCLSDVLILLFSSTGVSDNKVRLACHTEKTGVVDDEYVNRVRYSLWQTRLPDFSKRELWKWTSLC
jgi:RNase P/RNase MRP subunit POP5